MEKYPKIYGPYKRTVGGPDHNKLIIGDWALDEFAYLADNDWNFTEKVNGTNIRIAWDGHKVTFGGRTDDASLPVRLIQQLDKLFPEELMEQSFGDSNVILFGEAYGSKVGVNGSGAYGGESSFVLFDVLIGQWWLRRASTEDIAEKLGINVVPLILTGSLHKAIDMVRAGLKSQWGDFSAEGLVGTPTANLLTRAGERIMIKIKHKDFK
jgi:hypothetical protein